jgi:NSS family neurotransmitter:Na+ symporter
LIAWACGTGAVTVYGSYLNRSTDAIGIGTIAVLVGMLGQLLLLAVLAIGGGVIVATGEHDSGSRLAQPLIAVAVALANSGLPNWWAGLLLSVWFVALLAVAIPALLAMSEVLVASVVDKFSLPRERVVPAVGLVLFFLAAVLLADARTESWCFHGLLWVLLATIIGQSVCSLLAIKLDAVVRHLNAYSAFHLGMVWRLVVAVLMPGTALTLLVVHSLRDLEAAATGAVIAGVMLVAALVLVRLTGRSS